MDDQQNQNNLGQNMNQTTPLEDQGGVPNAPSPASEPQVPEPKKSMGPIVGIIIIVVLLILGGFYFWGAQLNERLDRDGDDSLPTAEDIVAQPDPELEALQEQSSSDEIDAIEADLDATELENLDEELADIDQELNF